MTLNESLLTRGLTQEQIDAAFSPENCGWPDHEKEFAAMSTKDQLRMIGGNAGFVLWIEKRRELGLSPKPDWGKDFNPFTCSLDL